MKAEDRLYPSSFIPSSMKEAYRSKKEGCVNFKEAWGGAKEGDSNTWEASCNIQKRHVNFKEASSNPKEVLRKVEAAFFTPGERFSGSFPHLI